MANSSSDAMPVRGTTPSRRQFFHTAGIAAGGLYALAAPSLAGPWVAGAEAAEKRSYIAGRFGLELDNVFCGMVSAFQGGNITADVVVERQGADRLPRKHLGNLKIEPITVEVGLEMSKAWNDWISKALNLELVRKNGAIIEMDQTFKEVGRRTFTNALISEIEFPACDGNTRTPTAITVTIVPETLKLEGGSGKQISSAGGKGKSLVSSNYRLNIQGLEQATQRASKIEAFGFRQSIAVQPAGQSRVSQVVPGGPAEFTNLAVAISDASAGPMYAWFDDFVVKGNSSAAKERPGVLEFLSTDMKTPIAAVQLYGLGVFKISSDSSPANSEKARLTKVEMYCQRMTFNP